MDSVVDIITGREGRRRWNMPDKARLVAETDKPSIHDPSRGRPPSRPREPPLHLGAPSL